MGEDGHRFAAANGFDQPAFVSSFDKHPGRQNSGVQKRLNHQRLAKFFHDDSGVDHAAAKAAFAFGNSKHQPTHIGKNAPVRSAKSAAFGNQPLPLVKRIFTLDKAGDAILQKLLLFAKSKFHAKTSKPDARVRCAPLGRKDAWQSIIDVQSV